MTDVVFKSPGAEVAIVGHYRKVLETWPIPRTEQAIPTRSGSTFVISCGPETAPLVCRLASTRQV